MKPAEQRETIEHCLRVARKYANKALRAVREGKSLTLCGVAADCAREALKNAISHCKRKEAHE